MDNFYMLWQRKSSVFTGEFACCRLGHKRTGRDGTEMAVTCDKTRIRPLVRALWDRKIHHLSSLAPFLRWIFHWRWASHTDIMMSDFIEDTAQANDPSVTTLDGMVRKYLIDQTSADVFNGFMGMIQGMFAMHPSATEPDDTPAAGGGGSVIMPQLEAWLGKWIEVGKDMGKYQVAMSVCFAVAEGNLAMLEKLHKEHGADLTLGYCWGITLLDFAAGKGHTRIIDYLFKQGIAIDVIDKPSFRERITAIDRACKAGFVDVVDMLVERGVTLTPLRLNRQTPAHGAAIQGYTSVLVRLHELGADLVHAYDNEGKSPLDYAVYYCHKEANEYLRSLHPAGPDGAKRTKREQKRLDDAAIKLQSGGRGASARKQANALRVIRAKAAAPAKTEAESAAAGVHM